MSCLVKQGDKQLLHTPLLKHCALFALERPLSSASSTGIDHIASLLMKYHVGVDNSLDKKFISDVFNNGGTDYIETTCVPFIILAREKRNAHPTVKDKE